MTTTATQQSFLSPIPPDAGVVTTTSRPTTLSLGPLFRAIHHLQESRYYDDHQLLHDGNLSRGHLLLLRHLATLPATIRQKVLSGTMPEGTALLVTLIPVWHYATMTATKSVDELRHQAQELDPGPEAIQIPLDGEELTVPWATWMDELLAGLERSIPDDALGSPLVADVQTLLVAARIYLREWEKEKAYGRRYLEGGPSDHAPGRKGRAPGRARRHGRTGPRQP